jgi:hypothetical protein
LAARRAVSAPCGLGGRHRPARCCTASRACGP